MTNMLTYKGFIRSELHKMSRLKSMIVVPIIMFLLIALQYATIWALNSVSNLQGATIPDGLDTSEILSGKLLLFSASSSASIGLFIAIICGLFIGGDFKSGMIKMNVARGADRILTYVSKWSAIMMLTLVYTVFSLLISGIFTAISGYGMPFDGHEFGLLMRSFAMQYLANAATASIFVAIAFLVRSKGSTIGICLGLYIIEGIFIGVIMAIVSFSASDSTWMLNALGYLPNQLLADACWYGSYTAAELLRIILMPIAYIVVFSGIGIASFLKRDIK